jgi:hypothetical protein
MTVIICTCDKCGSNIDENAIYRIALDHLVYANNQKQRKIELCSKCHSEFIKGFNIYLKQMFEA